MVVHHPRGGLVTWPPRCLAVARFHGLESHAAEAYRAPTQGQIERPLRSVRRTCWTRLRAVVDRPDLNRPAAHGVATVADVRGHQTPGVSPASRRAADVAALTSWAADHQVACGGLRTRGVPRDGYVRTDGPAGCVPPEGGGAGGRRPADPRRRSPGAGG